jgi:hypothetical protein
MYVGVGFVDVAHRMHSSFYGSHFGDVLRASDCRAIFSATGASGYQWFYHFGDHGFSATWLQSRGPGPPC